MLPLEVTHNILNNVNFKTLYAMRLVNPTARAIVNSLPSYRAMAERARGCYAPSTSLRALVISLPPNFSMLSSTIGALLVTISGHYFSYLVAAVATPAYFSNISITSCPTRRPWEGMKCPRRNSRIATLSCAQCQIAISCWAAHVPKQLRLLVKTKFAAFLNRPPIFDIDLNQYIL